MPHWGLCVPVYLPALLAALDSFYIVIEYIGTWTEERMAVFQTAADK